MKDTLCLILNQKLIIILYDKINPVFCPQLKITIFTLLKFIHHPLTNYLLRYQNYSPNTSTSNYITVSRVIWLSDGKLCLKQRNDKMTERDRLSSSSPQSTVQQCVWQSECGV